MSTLGARARAAEYAAFTAARARRVSQEAEDHKVPPKSTAVSLGAFTKPQPTNRNKGAKAWKPLSLDDIAENTDDASTDIDSGRLTPTPATRDNRSENILTARSRQISCSTTSTDVIKVNIPTGPRAMLVNRPPTTVIANPTPHRVPSCPMINLLPQQSMSVQGTPSPCHRGGIPYPYIPTGYTYSRHPLVTPERIEGPPYHQFGSMMVPDDISPAKQEEKLAMLSRDQARMNAASSTQHHVMNRSQDQVQQSMHQNPSYPEGPVNPYAPFEGNPYIWEPHGGGDANSVYGVVEGRHQGQMNAGLGGNNDNHREYPNPHPDSEYPQYRADIPTHDLWKSGYGLVTHQAPRTLPHTGQSRFECSGPSYSTPTDHDEPYDRKRKMQSFVAEATQEALARKGKTVLHNPDLYKNPNPRKETSLHRVKSMTSASDPSVTRAETSTSSVSDQISAVVTRVPVSWSVVPIPYTSQSNMPWEVKTPTAPQKDVIRGLEWRPELSMTEVEVLANAINNPAPGLPCPHIELRPRSPNGFFQGKPTDESLALVDPVGSPAWAQLRPMAKTERERVRACMTKAALQVAPKVPQPAVRTVIDDVEINKLRLDDSNHWFHQDGRGSQSLRARLPAIAEVHATNRKAFAAKANGGVLPNDFKEGLDDGVAANLILGEVMLNLREYVDGDRTSVEQRRNFHKVKSVPNFATERVGLLSGLTGMGTAESYFDGEQGGFVTAPVRIARDPRFRPQGEGLKLKPEEEWKNRHEMYGRRVL